MPGDGWSPMHGAPTDANRSIGQLTCMIENTRHVVEEQSQGRKAQQGSEAEVSEMRQQMLLLEQQQSVAV
eukprot:8741459-Prorocentrum_lima.AAC.1